MSKTSAEFAKDFIGNCTCEFLAGLNPVENHREACERKKLESILEEYHKAKAAESLGELAAGMKVIQSFVNEQSEDRLIWLSAHTSKEAYLQDQLRKLHQVIEDVTQP